MTVGVERISISTPKELLREFDQTTRRMGYDRSKAIQLAMRNLLTEYRWADEKAEMVAGAITFIYNHHTIGLEEALTDIEHHHSPIITSTMHLHLGEDDCMQIIAVKGPPVEIKSLSQEISAKRGVKQLRQAVVAP